MILHLRVELVHARTCLCACMHDCPFCIGGADDVINFWSNPGNRVPFVTIYNILLLLLEYTLSRLPMGGTTGCLATIVLPKEPAPPGTERLLEKLRTVIGRTDTGGAVLEGINAEVIQLLLIFIIIIIQGPIVNDLGGLPDSDNEMDEAQFETLINRIPSLKLMTISPHLEAQNGYKRLKLLIKKQVPTSLIYNNYFCLFL